MISDKVRDELGGRGREGGGGGREREREVEGEFKSALI